MMIKIKILSIFHIASKSLEEEGNILIHYKWNDYKIPYKVTYTANMKDIRDDLLLKRLQDRPLSCESSAAADILSYFFGKNITEYDVSHLLAKSEFNTPARIEKWEVYMVKS